MKTRLLLSAFLLCLSIVSQGQWTYTNLSEAKFFMGSATVGNKAYFAGGFNGTGYTTDVEVYDFSTGTWGSAGNLFEPRFFVGGSVSCGSKIFFAGGYDDAVSYNVVDIYDTELQEWSVEMLSVDRFSLAAVSHGNTVMFAGGIQMQGPPSFKNTVDIYNIETGEWAAPASLSQARGGIAATVVGDLAFFAGGWISTSGTTSNRVDIYNFTTSTWSQSSLSQARAYASAVTVGTKVIIAGGITTPNNPTDRVDIYDTQTGIWTQANLSVPRSFSDNGAAVGGKAYFAGGGIFMGGGFNTPSDVVDVYDPVTNTWSVMNLQEPRVDHSVLGVGNYLVVAGGKNDSGILSSVEIYHPTPPDNIIHVPGDYPTIQAGINASSDGDTVLVAENTYYENINFNGKAILLASEFIVNGDTNHISNTIINGSQPVDPDFGSVVTFESGEDTTSVLCGFTITGGTGTFESSANMRMGGGVHIKYSGGKLLNNYIRYNTVSSTGDVIGGGLQTGAPISEIPWIVLRGNRIDHNQAISSNGYSSGGGFMCWYNLIMNDNEISYNSSDGHLGSDGGGMAIYGSFGLITIDVSGNEITHNESVSDLGTSAYAALGGGMGVYFDVTGSISNNTISYNSIEAPDTYWSWGPGAFIQDIPSNGFVFENNIVNENTAIITKHCRGGGLSLLRAGGKYQNNVLQNNTASHGGAIGIIDAIEASDTAILINNTITNNEATSGGGINLLSSDVVVINSIIWGNTAPSGASIYTEGSNLEVRYSDVEGADVWPGEGNVNFDPQFQSDGYHLELTSMLLNRGATITVINGESYHCPAYDIDGDDRPFENTQPEIGVDELQLVSIDEPISTNNFSINLYPNPADQMVTISAKNGAVLIEANIYNNLGQNVYTGILVDNTLDISKLQPGIYIVELMTDQGKMREKLIVE